MRVVIAEDNALLREGLVLLLTSAGHQVVAVAGAGPEILPALETHRPDVAVLDGLGVVVEVPQMRGEQRRRRLDQLEHRQVRRPGVTVPRSAVTRRRDSRKACTCTRRSPISSG